MLFIRKTIVTRSTKWPGPQTQCQTHQLDVVGMAAPRVGTKKFIFVTMSHRPPPDCAFTLCTASTSPLLASPTKNTRLPTLIRPPTRDLSACGSHSLRTHVALTLTRTTTLKSLEELGHRSLKNGFHAFFRSWVQGDYNTFP